MSIHKNPRGMLAVRAEAPDVHAEVAAELVKFKAKHDAQADEIGGLKAMFADLEQKLIGRYDGIMPAGFGTGHRSPGAALAASLVKSEAWGAVANKRQTKTSIEVQTGSLLPNIQANTITYDTGGLSVVERRPEIVSGMQRRRWLRERILNVATGGGSVEYQRELTFTNNAAPQGGGSPFAHEGTAKPESIVTYETVERKIPTIAHFIKASKQVLADVAMLGATLDQRLLYGLELAVEAQILAGNGTGFTPTSGDSAIDSISRAIATLEAAEALPDVIVLHPSDFRAMQRLKSSGSGEFLFGAPGGTNGEAVWNRDVHVTPAMSAGYFLAMDSQQMGVLFTREDASVTPGWVDDDFTKNLVTILAETRLTIAVQRPAAVTYGALTL